VQYLRIYARTININNTTRITDLNKLNLTATRWERSEPTGSCHNCDSHSSVESS